MSRVRRIYQSDKIYVGPSPATGLHMTTGVYGLSGSQFLTANRIQQLHRVQSANYSFNIARQDVNQYGELAAIDRVILEQPTVSLSIQYLLANFANEANLGFAISSGSLVSAISGFLGKTEDEKNYFIKTVPGGQDAIGYNNADVNVLGIGNGFITSYTSEAAVGGFPSVSVDIEGLNMNVQAGTGGYVPAVFPTNGNPVTGHFYILPTGASHETPGSDLSTSVLRPGDINISLGTLDEFGAQISDIKIQNYSVSVDFARENIDKLGSKYSVSKEPVFPLNVNASFTALVGDMKTGNLVNTINSDTNYNLQITLNKPGTTVPMCAYFVRNAKLDSAEYTSSIGSNTAVTYNFTSQVAASTSSNGLSLSGSN